MTVRKNLSLVRRFISSSTLRFNNTQSPPAPIIKQKGILSSLSKIDGILNNSGTNKQSHSDSENTHSTSNKGKTSVKDKEKQLLIDGCYLNEVFKQNSSIQLNARLSPSEKTNISRYFNESRVDLNWSIYEYDKIPGEADRLELEQQQQQQQESQLESEEREEERLSYQDHNQNQNQNQNRDILVGENLELNDEFKDLDDKGLSNEKYESSTDEMESDLNIRLGRLKYLQNQESKKLRTEIENNLPEVIMLGRCNVGKSSLINAIMSNNNKSVTSYARVKQDAGYTPCLNFYNVGGNFRLVDSPGYGEKGRAWQGELVFQYLMNRRVLRNSYLILDGKIGMNQYDEMILNNLVELGIQFDIIFNKIDKIAPKSRVSHLSSIIDNSMLKGLRIQPRYYFVNSVEDFKKTGGLSTRTGINEIRFSLLESCGLNIEEKNLKPKLRKKSLNDTQEKIKRKNIQKTIKKTQGKEKKQNK